MERVECIGWLSKNSLNRYRPALIYSQLSLFTLGVFFWVDATIGAGNFKLETWGYFAYAFPAKMWAAWNMGASAITMIGLIRPVNNRMVAFGAFLQCLQFLVISYSTIITGGEAVVGLFASVFFLPLHMWLLSEAVRGGVNRV